MRAALRGRRLALVLVWFAVVMLGSAGVWTVIRGAGLEVSRTGVPTEMPADPPLPAPTRSVVPTAGPTTRPTGGQSGAQTGGPAVAPTGGPTGGPTGDQPGGPTGAATAGPTAAPIDLRQTWQGEPGTVAVACRGGDVRLLGAQANPDWHVDVRERGPGRVSVSFRQSTDDNEGVAVAAACSGSAPAFRTTSD